MLAVQNVTNTRAITSRPVTLDNVAGVMDGSIAADMDLSVSQYQNTSSIITTGTTTTATSTTLQSTVTSTVEFPHLQIGEADFIPAAGFQNATRAAFYPKFAAEGVSSFFSFYSVYDVLKKRNDPNKSKITFGKHPLCCKKLLLIEVPRILRFTK